MSTETKTETKTETEPAKKTAAKKVGEAAKQTPATEKKPEGAVKTGPTPEEKAEAARLKKEEADKKAKEKADEKAQKTKEREAKKAETAKKREEEKSAKRKPHEGVIFHIAKMLARKEGASKKEILDHLETTFPDREREKMEVTVGIQLTRLPKTHGFVLAKNKDDEARGLVYKSPEDLVSKVSAHSIRGKKSATAA